MAGREERRGRASAPGSRRSRGCWRRAHPVEHKTIRNEFRQIDGTARELQRIGSRARGKKALLARVHFALAAPRAHARSTPSFSAAHFFTQGVPSGRYRRHEGSSPRPPSPPPPPPSFGSQRREKSLMRDRAG